MNTGELASGQHQPTAKRIGNAREAKATDAVGLEARPCPASSFLTHRILPNAGDLDLAVFDLVPLVREEADLVEGEIVGDH